MSHCVHGLIANREQLEEFARIRSLLPPIPLTFGLAFSPLGDAELDTFLRPPLTAYAEGFIQLSEQLDGELALASRGGALMYLETDYFGGAGTQGAVLYRDGARVYGPETGPVGPINKALALLGVRRIESAQDEFESVGLDRSRSNEDWREGG